MRFHFQRLLHIGIETFFHLFSHTNPYDPHVIAKCLRNTQGLHYKGLNRLIERGLPVVALNEDSTSTQLFSK